MRKSPTCQWLHIGAGSFHRAHQAWYLHRLLQQQVQGEPWLIALGNIRDDVSPVLETLAAQQGRYVLETVTPAGERIYERIASVQQVIPWETGLETLLQVGCAATTRVISFTVTEGGYYLTPELELEQANQELQSDLQGGVSTIYGVITHILQRRMEQGVGGVTLLCCDNLRHNGTRFQSGLTQFLQLSGRSRLLAWLSQGVSIPNTMVDRITPRPLPELAQRVQTQTGVADRVPVMAESFTQWVVEDRFIAGRPALEDVGVELVRDVAPYEEAKVRILNASHSAIAWAGTLLGQQYIDESIRIPAIRQMAYDYITDDVIPCLQPSPLDLNGYRDTVLERFGNPHLQDTTQRVAADGLSKIPGFITPTLETRYRQGAIPASSAVLPALFFLFMQRWHTGTLPYTYQDGILDPAEVHRWYCSADPLATYANTPALFASLAGDPAFLRLLRHTLERLHTGLQNARLTAQKGVPELTHSEINSRLF